MTQITQSVGIAQSGVSRPLTILHLACAVKVRAEGPRRLYPLNPEPYLWLVAWLAGFHTLWSARLDRLAGAMTERPLKGRDHD